MYCSSEVCIYSVYKVKCFQFSVILDQAMPLSTQCLHQCLSYFHVTSSVNLNVCLIE